MVAPFRRKESSNPQNTVVAERVLGEQWPLGSGTQRSRWEEGRRRDGTERRELCSNGPLTKSRQTGWGQVLWTTICDDFQSRGAAVMLGGMLVVRSSFGHVPTAIHQSAGRQALPSGHEQHGEEQGEGQP